MRIAGNGSGLLAFMLHAMSSEGAKPFIARWAAATASERANSQPFLCELCNLLDRAGLGPFGQRARPLPRLVA